MNIQGVQQATDLCIQNSFSPLCKLADMVLFPHEDPIVSRFWTEQTVSLASLKCSRGSDSVLHSINKTHKKEETVSLSITDQIPEHIYTCRINQDHELLIDVRVAMWKTQDFHTIPMLLDSRANATFINTSVTEQLGLLLEALTTPIHTFNINSSCNSVGNIIHTTTITMEYLGHQEELHAEVMNLGKNSLILGYTWLKKHNPVID